MKKSTQETITVIMVVWIMILVTVAVAKFVGLF